MGEAGRDTEHAIVVDGQIITDHWPKVGEPRRMFDRDVEDLADGHTDASSDETKIRG